MTLLQEITEGRKARLRRIARAAWKPCVVQPEPAVVAPPLPVLIPWPPARSAEEILLLRILSEAPPILPIETYPRPRKIQKAVALYYGIDMVDLLSRRRWDKLIRPRHIAIYLCKALTPLSYPDIARRFNMVDHTSARYAALKIGAQIEADPALVVEIEELKQLIGQTHAETKPAGTVSSTCGL